MYTRIFKNIFEQNDDIPERIMDDPAALLDFANSSEAREEMKNLTADNERILSEAKKQRDEILKEAREMKSKIISEAKDGANIEVEKLLLSAKDQINTEKAKALNELKNTISDLSIEMASKVINTELSNPAASKKMIEEALNETKLN